MSEQTRKWFCSSRGWMKHCDTDTDRHVHHCGAVSPAAEQESILHTPCTARNPKVLEKRDENWHFLPSQQGTETCHHHPEEASLRPLSSTKLAHFTLNRPLSPPMHWAWHYPNMTGHGGRTSSLLLSSNHFRSSWNTTLFLHLPEFWPQCHNKHMFPKMFLPFRVVLL
jgi:hypothetical protein